MSVFRVGDRVIRTGVSKDGVVKGDYHYWACNKFKKANKWWKDG